MIILCDFFFGNPPTNQNKRTGTRWYKTNKSGGKTRGFGVYFCGAVFGEEILLTVDDGGIFFFLAIFWGREPPLEKKKTSYGRKGDTGNRVDTSIP